MAQSPEERKARLNERRRDLRAAHKAMKGPKPAPVGQRMTGDPFKAAHIRDYATGRTFGPETSVFKKCLRLFSKR